MNARPPTPLRNRIARLLIGTGCCALIAVHQIALAHGWKAPVSAAEKKNPIPATPESIEAGKDVYRQFCARCHGAKADGKGPVAAEIKTRTPDLRKRVAHHADGDFFWKIKTGRGDMPSFKGDLMDSEIWSVIHYIRRIK